MSSKGIREPSNLNSLSLSTRDAQTTVACSICNKVFTTKSHLRRHEASHVPVAKLTCNHCGGVYRRRDVLRRHLRTCKKGGDWQPPDHGKPGRKRKACNACATARSFCDGDCPCEACLQRGFVCSFARTHQQSHKSISPNRLPSQQLPGSLATPSPATPISQSVKLSIPFLLHYTDVENESRYESLRLLSQCNPADSRSGCCVVNHQSHHPPIITESWESLFKSFINTATLDTACSLHAAPGDRFDLRELENTSSKILSLLANRQYLSEERLMDIDRAKQLFSPPNIAKFLEAFFDNAFHNHFINPATFRLSKASTLLILTMVLLGAVYTSPYNGSDLEMYSSITEHLIFSGPSFQQLIHPGINALNDARTLETIQAAMLVVTLQAYKHDPDSIRRVRLQRLPALFSAIRMLNLNQITNDCIPNVSGRDAYLLREGLVRVMAGIYLLDCYCVIFFRYPTQLRIEEVLFAIPERDDLFNARDATEFEQLAAVPSEPGRKPRRVRSVLRDLMRAEGRDPHREDYLPSTVLGSFLVLSALQCVLFDLLAVHALTDEPGIFNAVERGLDRWKAHWDDLSRGASDSPSTKRAGFIIHAVEYWWVAKALVRHPSVAVPEYTTTTTTTNSSSSSHDDHHDSFRRLVDRLTMSH
ncbi:hypothetical protein BO82DRAFT_96300 [Aspergillus uvarum CBS 121591]|uniref:C2H2-type domain-containing protein n=1 Tax=Aspergillus uvarum CBS 121591 TaxID=1448315 RepID=A0A319DPG8_9EURO|nr:hypothetical protein BO82DRAFT_96300 [Aspergillus uvarum CBS 121591]PYH81182.1 hypothetical protein BO82DRAFT_96300 [Aspergillus uvarum CBS 121591]